MVFSLFPRLFVIWCLASVGFFLSSCPVITFAQTDPVGPTAIEKKAVDFVRFELDDNAKVEWIRKTGNLSGKGPGTDPKQTNVTGWVEYDFSVAAAGWYGLSVKPGGAGHEFTFDGKDAYFGTGGSSSKIANIWLEPGKHTLRINRSNWTGFSKITSWKLTPAGPEAEDRIQVRTTTSQKVLRQGETLPVTVSFGELATPVKLTLSVKEVGKQDVIDKVVVDLPAGGGLQEIRTTIPASRQGIFEIDSQVDDLPAQSVSPGITFAVIDTKPVLPAAVEVEKRLVAEIDPVKLEPDYFKGETKVVNKPWGSYRESGDVGYLQHKSPADSVFSWFAYKFQVDDPDGIYWMEFDYPDDAKRTFVVVPRSDNSLMYAGPATGPDAGREFSLTNRMQTMGIYFWPHSTNLRVAVMQAQTGMKAAVSKIRIYKVESDFVPLPHREDGRDFIHWYEEGSSYMGFFGASNKSPNSVILSSEKWAGMMAYMGASMLMPTLSIYQMAMYPSAFNPNFADSNTFDSARVIELMCEKYGLKFVTEFHTEARHLRWPSVVEKSPDSISQFNRFGKVWSGGAGPTFNFLHPIVERFVIDMIGEFADRYGDSPAFDGVSIRLMGWQNTGFGNFDSLDWGYGDFTINLFEKETGIQIPVDAKDPERFGKRYDWLLANKKNEWINWRCKKGMEFFSKVSARIREKNPEAKLYLTDFLTPSNANSEAWYPNFAAYTREAGVDPALLANVPGVELINATVSYGRRNAEDVDQRQRDSLLNPAMAGLLKQEGKPFRFMGTQAYFEGPRSVLPPKELGYPEKTHHGWISGAVNPAGRHYLERVALMLAEFDAGSLGDGGNGYSLGQPLLRDFLIEYRALPREKFQARPDARDPVAVWERKCEGDFMFYAVNRERYPVTVGFEFAAPPNIKRPVTGETVPVEGKSFALELQPYELRVFSAPAGTQIEKVTETIPAADAAFVQKMTGWLRRLADDVQTGTVGGELTSAQKSFLNSATAEAESCLKEGRFWRARTLQEDQRLREIYAKCARPHPYIDQIGSPMVPEGALSAKDLLPKLLSKQASLVPSEKLNPEWTGQQLVFSPAGELTFTIDVPVDGKYRLRFGQALGEGFADSTVRVDGKDIGVLKSSAEPVRGVVAMPQSSVSLTAGKHQLSLVPVDGKRQALFFVELTPVFQDIVANRWMIAGPFRATPPAAGVPWGTSVSHAMKNSVLPPEKARDFSQTQNPAEKEPWKWQRLGSQDDFVNFEKLTGQGDGSIHYAVTYIVSPVERDLAISYSSDYFTRMWLNDQIVLDSYHPTGHPRKGDLKRNLHLKKGVNELLLKVGAGSVGNGFWLAVNNPGDLKFAPMISAQQSDTETNP